MIFILSYYIIDKMQYSDIGKYVRKKRKELPKSLSDFAVECEIEPAALSRFERGFGDVCFQNFIKITKGFNESPAEFLKEFEIAKSEG